MDRKIPHVLLPSFVLLVLISEALAVNMQVGNTSVKCIQKERLSLLSLKQGFADPHGFLSSWGNVENQKECCNWEGVWCSNRSAHHVVKLYLSYYNLEGTITPSLTELHHLNYLDLSGNTFNLTQFPSFIFSLTLLKHLILSSMNLKGTIPNELGDLFHLRELDLSRNLLEGEIPKSLGLCSLHKLNLSGNSLSGQLDGIVASFSRCANKSLQYLDLSRNQIVGPLPDISRISSLQVLNLHFNELNGTLSDSIGQLSNLNELRIGHNSLHGVISETHFLELSKLQLMDLSSNDFVFNISSDWVPPFQMPSIFLSSCRPAFPRWLRTQKTCSVLDISNAQISETIPNWFWNFPFKKLNLSHNQITGEIPNLPIQNFANSMDLSSNLFEGPIPSNLSYLQVSLDLYNNRFTDASSLLCPNMATNILVLNLSKNNLFGVLPDCWIYFKLLVVLDVRDNRLSGKIPMSMSLLDQIEALHLSFNEFHGEIPLVLNKCMELRTFDVAHNNFTGSIPNWIGDRLKKLRILSMGSNMFYGSLPSNICQLSQVQIVDLPMNNISGSLPKCLNQLSALADQTNPAVSIIYNSPCSEHYYHHNFSILDSVFLEWKGKNSEYKSTLGLVKGIDLFGNKLTGEIPSEVIDLIGLIFLNISRNMISGRIPTSVGRLKSLDFLGLSRNCLYGNIPSELSQLDHLSMMDLLYNNLLGKIPVGTQLQSFDASVYEGNEDLCGAPLPECPTKQPKYNESEGNSKDDDEQLFTRGFFISLSIGFSTGFCGVCSLLLKKSWKYTHFKLLNDVNDQVCAVVAINVAKLCRRNRAST